MKYFNDSGIPTGFALSAIAAEILGPLGLAVGLLTRVAAFGIACVMVVAIITVHWPHGFFMDWNRDLWQAHTSVIGAGRATAMAESLQVKIGTYAIKATERPEGDN